MGLGSEISVLQLNDDNELENFGEIETKLKSNGGYHVEDVNQKSLPQVNKRQGLKKWRRIDRDSVKKSGNNVTVNVNGDYGSGRPILVTRADSGNSEEGQNSRSSTAASAPRFKHDDQQRNGRIEPGKKARGFIIEKENSVSTMGSDSRSSNFVFVQGFNTVASKGRQSGVSAKYDEDCSDDDAHFADKNLEFLKSDDESEDVAVENSWKVKEERTAKHEDALVESVKGLHSAHEELDKEVQKWMDLGKNNQLIIDNSIHDLLEIKDAKILKLESALNSVDFKIEFEDRLMKIIQAEVEYVVIKATTESLTAGPLREIKHNLQQKNASVQDLQVPKKQVEKLETQEDVKKLQNRVCRFTSCFMIQLILLIVTLYLKFAPQNVEVVPT